ncbi:MAG TPA: hypothetical protein PKJ84_16300, partial [Anaerolineales bacterium]|nr:hypothetical protein [Anaerolineales bacterium]
TAILTRLCLDPNLRQQMRISARQASSAYSIERTTGLMLQQYERLVNGEVTREEALNTRLREILERFLK